MKKKLIKFALTPLVVFVAALFLVPGIIFAAPEDDAALAMEAPPGSTAAYSGDPSAMDVFNSFGNISPQDGNDFTILSSGEAAVTGDASVDFGNDGEPNDSTTLSIGFIIPTGSKSLLFDFYFISAEYPEFVGSQYNDEFTATITGSSVVPDGTNIAQDKDNNPISVNSVNFTGSSSDLAGTKFEDDGSTGWLTAGASVNQGDNVNINFNVKDVGDGSYDSTVILDNFSFENTSVETGIQEPNIKKVSEPEPVWVRTMPMTCCQVWINEEGDFQFIFWYPYKDKNWVRIYDMEDNMVFEVDLPYHDPNIIVDLPDGFYMVRTYHDQELLQEFLIGKP